MNKCTKCGSHAINHHLHGRDGCYPDLCDVCFWRSTSARQDEIMAEQRRTITALTDGVEAYGLPQETTPVIRFIAAMEEKIERQQAEIERLRSALSEISEMYDDNFPDGRPSRHAQTTGRMI